MTEALRQLHEAGVAVWLDDLRRDRLLSGALQEMADDRRVVGVTSNPTIFEKAMSSSDVYDEQVRDLATLGVTREEAVRLVTTRDVRMACDVLSGVHDSSDGVDGRVSIEVDPRLARDAARTVAEAQLLWWLVDRPNLLVKIPGTIEGLDAITATLAAGISVNVTLIFSLKRYEAVQQAFLAGLEQARDNGLDVSQIHSVASFFVSRVDSEVDERLDKIGTDDAAALRGKAAIANARLAYRQFERLLADPRWHALEEAGARPQRPLWASTSVKDPAYDDTRYVVELVAPQTVNTMPESTIDAVSDHAQIRGDTVTGAYAEADQVLEDLAAVGVDYDDVVAVLENEGVAKFETSWIELLETMENSLQRLRPGTGSG